jgi:hypothetical protein
MYQKGREPEAIDAEALELPGIFAGRRESSASRGS